MEIRKLSVRQAGWKLEIESGFTLIELLVVIAVISILMAALVVGLNPAARIDEAKEARARSNVAQIGSAMEACIVKNEGSEAACNTWAELYSGEFVKLSSQPAGVVVGDGCASEEEAGSLYCKYQTSTGKVDCDQTTACTAGT